MCAHVIRIKCPCITVYHEKEKPHHSTVLAAYMHEGDVIAIGVLIIKDVTMYHTCNIKLPPASVLLQSMELMLIEIMCALTGKMS